MNDHETNNIVIKTLLTKAEHDLKIAQDELCTTNPVYDMIGFHIQQFIEKYLKAFLLFNGVKPLRTHSISVLLNECIKLDVDFSIFLNDITLQIEDCAVAVRYDELDNLDQEFIKQGFEVSHLLKEMIEGKLNKIDN